MKLPMALLVVLACTSVAARAADLSHAVMLVATEQLAGSGYEEAVLIAAPLPQGGHLGFIVNRPTVVKLETLLPGDELSRKVSDPVYLGGPILFSSIFAVTRQKIAGEGQTIELLPGLVAVFDAASLDRILETAPNDARYFVGLMIWRPGELDDEIQAGAWDVAPADADAVLGSDPAQWKKLSGPFRRLP